MLAWVVEGIVREIIAGSLGLSEIDPPYSFPVFLELIINKGSCWGRLCVVGEVTEVHVIDIFVGKVNKGRGEDM